MKQILFVIILLIIIMSAQAEETTRTSWLFNCIVGASRANPNINCQGASKEGWSGSGAFRDYATAARIDLNPCAASGVIVGGTIDDTGALRIGGAQFSDSKSGEDCPSANHAGGGTFDPQTADVSFNVNNGGGGEAELCAQVRITYRSQNGYTWDGVSCTQEVTPAPFVNPPLPAVEFTKVSSTYCASNGSLTVPVINLLWGVIEGANNYNVYVDGKLHTNVSRAAFTNNLTATALLLLPGIAHDWSVAAMEIGPQGEVVQTGNPGESVRVASAVCKDQSSQQISVPDHFTHAYFASVKSAHGQKNVTAYQNEDGATLIYKNFITDFSRGVPETAVYTLNPQYTQIITVPAESMSLQVWNVYTTSLRMSDAPGAPFGGALRGLQGYNTDSDQYSATVQSDNDYLILYGTFIERGNKISIGEGQYDPDFESSTQINVPLVTRPASGSLSVRVVNNMTSTSAIVVIQ